MYFLQTNLDGKDDLTVWTIYNILKEVESSFRSMKTDLNLRPVFHKKDMPCLAYLHLGAYWVVATIRYQLKQKGYDGEIIGMTTMGAGNLETAGEDAAGVVWPSNFSARSEVPSTQEFVKAYEEKYGELPNNYAAEGYDAVWLLARGIKEANSADRVAIREGIAKVAAEGFDGAQGPLSFENNDVRVEGVIASWNGSEEVVVTLGDD